MDLTEAKDIKKRWQEYTEEIYRKGFNDLDNHYGMMDILECDVKWALGNITGNKASGADEMPAELFQVLKVLHAICQQIWKTH